LAQVGAGGQRRAIAGECAVPNERSQSRTFYCQDQLNTLVYESY
jgi:hypothetical protein